MGNLTNISTTAIFQYQPEHLETVNILRRAMYEYRRKLYNGAKKQGKKIKFALILDSVA